MDYLKNSHCSYCGAEFDLPLQFTFSCIQCNQITYLNPLPVAVVLIPVEETGSKNKKSLLCIVRNIDPGKGGLALPGGYIEQRESWQEAAAREVFEETGIRAKEDKLRLFDVISVPNAILIFSIAPIINMNDLSSFKPSEEISAIKIIHEPEKMTFSSHSEVVEKYFKG